MEHKILLLDELGEKWGKTHIYHDLKTPADAIKLLCVNHPSFAKYLVTSHEKGIVYRITQVDTDLEESDLFLPLGKHDLVITPVITGSGDAFKFIGGAFLVGIGIVSGGTGFALGAGGFGFTGFSAAAIAGNIGAYLLIKGVSDMLTPQLPTFDITGGGVGQGGFLGGPSSIERGADGQQSYAYRGAANTVGIGKTIPVVYGKALIGGHLISTTVEVEDESDSLKNTFVPPGPDTCLVNGNEIRKDGSKTSIYEGLLCTRVGFGKKPSAYHGRKFALIKNLINLGSKARQKISNTFDIDAEGDLNEENMNLMIDFSGIRDRVGGAGTTIIHGYITFDVIVEEPGSETLVLNERITVQGLMQPSQKIRYIFRFAPVHMADTGVFDVFIQIIDKELLTHKETKMIVRRLGYKFFKGGKS
tara:strand:+ start:211 stop:1461 length:1251 start_codon:yes stop_codon:yes gene_type:complete